MKKYGDDADLVHDQGTRVEASKRGYEKNQLRHNYSYRSVSKPKSTYKPKTYNKSTYKPDYSKTYSRASYSRKSTYKSRYSTNTNRTKKTYQNNSTYTTSNSSENEAFAGLFCICGIIAIFVSIDIGNPIASLPICIGLLSIACIIWWIIEKISKNTRSVKNEKKDNSKNVNEWKTCPGCGRKLIKVQKKCPYCKHIFE